MKKLLFLWPVAMLVVGCGNIQRPPSEIDTKGATQSVLADLERQRAQGVDTRPYRFECEGLGSVVVSYRLPQGETTRVALVTPKGGQGDTRRLPQVPSGSGERYTDGRSEWATKGDGGLLSLEGGKSASCRLVKIG